MEEKIRARKAKERAEDALNSFLEKAERIGGMLPQEKKFWGGIAQCLEAIAEMCALFEQDIPGTGGGGQKRRLPQTLHVSKETEHSLWC